MWLWRCVELAVFVLQYAYLRWIIAFTGFQTYIYLWIINTFKQTTSNIFQLFRMWKNCSHRQRTNQPSQPGDKNDYFILFLVLKMVTNLPTCANRLWKCMKWSSRYGLHAIPSKCFSFWGILLPLFNGNSNLGHQTITHSLNSTKQPVDAEPKCSAAWIV